MPESSNVAAEFLSSTISTFRVNKSWADRAIEQLSESQLRTPLDSNTNSVAIIMKHVSGNLQSRWTDFLTSDGEKSWRNRDDEFIDTFADRDEIIDYWEAGWARLVDSLASLSASDLTKEIRIRGESHGVIQAIQRSLAHTSYHVGQIVQVARVQAADQWNTITIPRGGSEQFNRQRWGDAGWIPKK